MKVHGVEISEDILNSLNYGKTKFYENGLEELVGKVLKSGNFTYSKELKRSILPQTFIITVGTPIDKTLESYPMNVRSITTVVEQIKNNLIDEDLILLRSTVKINTTEDLIKPILDQAKKRYYLAFAPERTLEEKAIEELKILPQIVGGVDMESTNKAKEFFEKIGNKVIAMENSKAAEMAKLLCNIQRDVKFGFFNEVRLLCEAVGLNALEVINACNHDYPRSDIALPAPVGEPCLEKDTYILAEGLKEYNYTPLIALAARN
ncbi:nucleotide sugar dehydrogenase [Reticulomyxa filosa]|uniref:Nucleotide sugar dehydrogenase n=1 Tax=Reticulomyxa filosa TaxID=46433 RepID=X6P9Y0_RETFI|nr:nucleotide sugar dehydrogenase [Reticulomyxa filosa]|eukprot:ETO34918.1 nucleotide sugar dehydrogenase [Reticulomyxa filosa]